MLADVACSERVCSFTSKCQVKGGVFIVHHVHEGKHQYAVENVVKYKNTTGEKMFARYKSDIGTLFIRCFVFAANASFLSD